MSRNVKDWKQFHMQWSTKIVTLSGISLFYPLFFNTKRKMCKMYPLLHSRYKVFGPTEFFYFFRFLKVEKMYDMKIQTAYLRIFHQYFRPSRTWMCCYSFCVGILRWFSISVPSCIMGRLLLISRFELAVICSFPLQYIFYGNVIVCSATGWL